MEFSPPSKRRYAAPKAFQLSRLALLQTATTPGSDILEFNFVAPTSEGESCWASLVDLYTRTGAAGGGEEASPPPPLDPVSAEDLEGLLPLSPPLPPQPDPPEPSPSPPQPQPKTPLILAYDCTVDWKRTSHQARVNSPYKEGTTLATIITKWTNYHQKNASQAFHFLEVKPSLTFEAEKSHFALVLPPGCSVYCDDRLFWPLLGFSSKKIKSYAATGESSPSLYGFQNRTGKTLTLIGDEGKRYPGNEVESLLAVPRAQFSLREHQPREIRITFILDRSVSFAASGSSPSGSLLEAATDLVAEMERLSNLDVGSLAATTLNEKTVLLSAAQKEGNVHILRLAPTQETADTLGVERTTNLLHFGLDAGAAAGSGLVAASPYVSRLTLSLPSGSGPSPPPPPPEPQESLQDGREAGEDSAARPPERTVDDDAAIAVAATPPPSQAFSLRALAPFAVILLGGRSTSYVTNWGMTSVVGYYNKKLELTPVRVSLPGDQSNLCMRLIASDFKSYIFQETLDVYAVLEIESHISLP